MDQQGSTPENTQGGQQDPSPQPNSADNAAGNQQPSQNESQSTGQDQLEVADDQAYGNDDSGGAPSQTTEDDDQQQGNDDAGQQSSDQSTADDDLKQWADSQNISLKTPTEIALAKRLRDTQKAFHGKNQNKQELEKPSQTNQQEDPVASQLQAIQGKLARAEFFETHPDARELEGAMYDAAIAARDAGDITGFEYYKTPQGWNTLYSIVKAQSAETASNDSYETGRKDERTNLAKKQQAAAPTSAAVNSAPGSTQITDEAIGKMTTQQYDQFRRDNPDWNPFAG